MLHFPCNWQLHKLTIYCEQRVLLIIKDNNSSDDKTLCVEMMKIVHECRIED